MVEAEIFIVTNQYLFLKFSVLFFCWLLDYILDQFMVDLKRDLAPWFVLVFFSPFSLWVLWIKVIVCLCLMM